MPFETPAPWRSTSATAGSPAYHRASRHKREAQRTRDNALLLLAADPRVQYRGADHTVAALAAGLAFERHDLTIVRVASGWRAITLVIAPTRLWHRPTVHNQLILLRRRARNVGVRVLLVPQHRLKRQPRLDNSALVVASANAGLTLSQRFRIELFLKTTTTPCSIQKCAELLADNGDPFAAIMSMVLAGRLVISLDQPISPLSLVWLPPGEVH